MAKSRASEHELICSSCEAIANQLGIDTNRLRHVRCVYHNGQQWTVEERWEQLVDYQWRPVELEQ